MLDVRVTTALSKGRHDLLYTSIVLVMDIPITLVNGRSFASAVDGTRSILPSNLPSQYFLISLWHRSSIHPLIVYIHPTHCDSSSLVFSFGSLRISVSVSLSLSHTVQTTFHKIRPPNFPPHHLLFSSCCCYLRYRQCGLWL